MGFFDDEGFGIEDFFKNISGGEPAEHSSVDGNGRRRVSRKSSEDITKIPQNQIITKKQIFLVFDFSGFSKVDVKIKDEELINNYGEKVHTGKKALEISDGENIIGNYTIPKEIKIKGFEWTFNNGILEVIFKR